MLIAAIATDNLLVIVFLHSSVLQIGPMAHDRIDLLLCTTGNQGYGFSRAPARLTEID
jgi:hypothetical protein